MKFVTLAAVTSLMLVMGMNTAEAHPRKHHHTHTTRVVVDRDVVVRPAPVRTAVARVVGSVFDVLPDNHVRVVHAGRTYYVHDGIYYVREPRGYVVVKPVTGIRVTTLPRGYTTVRVGGETLYRYRDITYRRIDGVYIVV